MGAVMKMDLNPEEIAELQRLRDEGLSGREVAATFGITYQAVGLYNRRAAAPRGTSERAPAATRLECLAAAYPWAVTLPLADQEEFAQQLAEHPRWMTERHIDRLIWQWRQKATATEPDAHKVSLLETAFPWSMNLPLSDRARFAHEISNHHGGPFELAELVDSWRAEAAACLGRAS